jgi:hypothetical protein
MWLFLSRRLRMWLIVTLALPVATGVLRRLGEAVERRNGPNRLSNGLLQAGRVGDRARARLRGR